MSVAARQPINAPVISGADLGDGHASTTGQATVRPKDRTRRVRDWPRFLPRVIRTATTTVAAAVGLEETIGTTNVSILPD